MKKYKLLFLPIFLTALINCTPTADCSTSGSSSATVSWDQPHAYEVTNVAGGGHKIYYSSQSGVTTSSTYVDVPYTSSPTSGTISNLVSGCTYYVRVQAYSALNPSDGGLSTESSFTVQ